MAWRLFLIAFVVSLGLTALLIRWAPKLRLVDQPGERKVHTRPTPRGGGLAIFLGFLVAMLDVWSMVGNLETLPHALIQLEIVRFVGLGFLVVLLGILDDWFSLPWPLRLGLQFALALGAVAWVVPHAVLRIPYSVFDYALAVFWIVALLNAFNMLDNMDALSAGVAWIAAGAFALLVWRELWRTELSYLMLMGALTGFLCFNRPPARIFMGDAGSTFLGFFLGVLTLADHVIRPSLPQTWLVAIGVLAVPLYDQATVVALRLWQRRSPFHADKQHLSHRLVALGLSQPMAVGVILLLGLVSGACGVALRYVSEGTAWLIGGGLLCGWIGVALVEYVPQFRRKV